MSTTHRRRRIILSNVTVKLGCSSSSCIRRGLTSIFHSRRRIKQKPKNKTNNNSSSSCSYYYSSSSSWGTNTSTLFSPHSSESPSDFKTSKAVQGFGRIGGESVAVEKDSDDPYLDFRQSMLQMILEKEIYNKDDLKELLNCFLQLNSPYYHGIIIRAFTEIWNGVFSLRPGVAGASSPFLHGGEGHVTYM
ncbi:Transcription repressor OFP6 [Capsicum annuum]|uniref:transcription repressor OFP6 n=1 Tax=Capsicum annuum TaxID=4072 RepID=UPI0007BFE663|nr:transcription repressor OFP6 [Capsicum annuum]KAF3636056.1 Transcription repressor OFP6 [Capsicum annuum]KAF3661786.1 Transcription repressor OFP6 [Capsicum annuum]